MKGETDWQQLGDGQKGVGTTNEYANGVPRVGALWLGVGVRAKARVVSLDCGVRGKGESRKWSRKIHSAQGTLSRGVRIVRAKR